MSFQVKKTAKNKLENFQKLNKKARAIKVVRKNKLIFKRALLKVKMN